MITNNDAIWPLISLENVLISLLLSPCASEEIDEDKINIIIWQEMLILLAGCPSWVAHFTRVYQHNSQLSVSIWCRKFERIDQKPSCVSGLCGGAEQADHAIPGTVCRPASVSPASYWAVWLSQIQLPLQKREKVPAAVSSQSLSSLRPFSP